MYGIYGNMDPINIPPMLVYIYIHIPYMDPMGYRFDRHLDQSKVLEVTLGALNEFVEKKT